MKTFFAAVALMMAGAVMVPTEAGAVGCLSGAAVGGVGGHIAGHHAVLGAIAGCAVGHHMATVRRREDQQRAYQNQNYQNPNPAYNPYR